MYQYTSTTNKSAATPLRRSAPSTDATPQELTLLSLMRSSSRSPTTTRTFLAGGPAGAGDHVPPDRDMVIGIIESALSLIEDDNEEEEKPKLPGAKDINEYYSSTEERR